MTGTKLGPDVSKHTTSLKSELFYRRAWILLQSLVQSLVSPVPFNSCNSDVSDSVGLAKLAVPLCNPDTGVWKPPTTLSPPSVLLWVQRECGGLCQRGPGRCLSASCSWPSQPSEPALMGFQPCCSTVDNTGLYWVGAGGLRCQPLTGGEGPWIRCSTLSAWLPSSLVAS